MREELAKLQQLVTEKDEEKKNHTYSLIRMCYYINFSLISNNNQNRATFSVQKESLKKVCIGITLVALSMGSGIIVVTTFAADIFIDSGTGFSPYLSSVIVGVLQVCGICVSSVLVDRVGRKILFGVSSFASAFFLFFFGLFLLLKTNGTDLSIVDWLPVTCLSIYIFVNCVGLRTVPFLYIAEILPYNVCWIGWFGFINNTEFNCNFRFAK